MNLTNSQIEITKAILVDVTNLRFMKACPTVRQCEYWKAIFAKADNAPGDMKVIGFAKRYWSAFTFRELCALLYNHSNKSGQYSSTDMRPLIFDVVSLSQLMAADETPEELLIELLGAKLGPTYVVQEIPGSQIVYRINEPYDPVAAGFAKAPSNLIVEGTGDQNGGSVPPTANKQSTETQEGAEEMATAKKAAAKKAPAKKTPAAKPAAAPKTSKEAKPKREKIEQNGIVRPGDPTGKCGRVWAIADEVSKKKKSPASFEEIWAVGAEEGLNESNVRVEYARWRKFNGVEGRVKSKEAKAAK